MSATPSAGPDAVTAGRTRPGALAVATGVGAVAVATVAGTVLAAVLALLGLTSTPPLRLGPWLAGLGLLGGWSQSVSATVAGGLEWSTWAAGAPLLVTGCAIAAVAVAAHRFVTAPGPAGGAAHAALAAAGAAIAAAVLVLVSLSVQKTVTEAGTVTVREGLTWLWTGGSHPGTVVGAALLVGVTWWVATGGADWWRQGRALAYGLLVWPGLPLTVLTGAAVAYLTSSPAVGTATVLLFPLAGTLLLLGLGGVPVAVGVTRLSPEPYLLSIWDLGPAPAVIGLAALLVLALVVGLVLRLRRHRGGLLPGVVVPVLAAAAIAWASGTSVVVPSSLGGATALAAGPWEAATVTGILALVALAARGHASGERAGDP